MNPSLSLALGVFAAAALSVLAEEPTRRANGIADNSFLVEEAYNQEAGVVQHVLTLQWDVDKQNGPDDRAWALGFTQEWPVFSQQHQLSYTIPYSFRESGGQSDNGIEDVQLHYRFQTLMETDRLPAFAPRATLILPTGDEEDGFGSDTVGVQFNLPVSKVVHDRWTLHANAGVTILPDVRDHDLVSYNLGASAIFAVTKDFNLMVELIGNWDEDVNDAGNRDRAFSAVVSPGLRYAFNFANDSQLVLGLAAPIGLNHEAPDYGIFFYCSFEHFFARR